MEIRQACACSCNIPLSTYRRPNSVARIAGVGGQTIAQLGVGKVAIVVFINISENQRRDCSNIQFVVHSCARYIPDNIYQIYARYMGVHAVSQSFYGQKLDC